MTSVDTLVHAARDLAPSLVALRRDLHRHPELGFEEHRTRAVAREAIEAAGWVVTADSAQAGLVATLNAPPTVLLRACMDALPLSDAKSVDYRSTTEGVCHACGHDAQIAVLVGAARLLARTAPEASVALLFQPAEEIDTGARAVLDSGALDPLDLHVILGFHGHPALPAGRIAVAPGPIMSCITTVRAHVTGRGGHGAEPHLATDVVSTMAALVLDWQVSLGRRVDGRAPCVLSVGHLQAGATPNVMPGEGLVEGTLRYLDPTIGPDLHDILAVTAAAVSRRFGTEVDLDLREVVPAVVNDSTVSRTVAQAAEDILGVGAVEAPIPSLGGDDFAVLLSRAPGAYFFLGEGQPDRSSYGWHDPSYDLDEASLPSGAAVLALAAIRASTLDHEHHERGIR